MTPWPLKTTPNNTKTSPITPEIQTSQDFASFAAQETLKSPQRIIQTAITS